MQKFTSKLCRQGGGMGYHYITVPHSQSDLLMASGHKRVLIELEGVRYRRALISMKEADGFIIIFGLDVLRAHHLAEGDVLICSIVSDPNPNDLGIPEELAVWLDQDEDAARIWNGFTPGLQRSLCYYINSAKRAETKFKRTEELVRKIKTGQLYSQRNAAKK